MARKSSTTRPRPAAEQHEIDVADGQERIGTLRGAGRCWKAKTVRGRVLGTFASRQEAMRAVCEAAKRERA